MQDLLKQGKGEEDVRRALAERRASVGLEQEERMKVGGRNRGLSRDCPRTDLRYKDNPSPPFPDDFDPDMPRPFVLPPPGPVVQWDFSPADLLDWRDVNTELHVHPKRGLGDLETHAALLAGLLSAGISGSLRLLQEVLDALAAVRADRMQCWISELRDCDTIGIRPDAVWVHHGHAYPGEELRAFPLDGMEEVLHRRAEMVRRYEG